MKLKKIKINTSTLFIYQKSKMISGKPSRSTSDPTSSATTTGKTTGMF